MIRFSFGVVALAIVGCSTAVETQPAPSTMGGASAEGGGGMASSGGAGGAPRQMLPPQMCDAGSFAIDIDENDMLVCAPFDEDVASAAETGCAMYTGWRDGCSGCTAGPAKVGWANGAACENIAGADNTCIQPTLGATTLPLFGLNVDGDVDGNDMFYAGMFCAPQGETASAGPCGAGEYAVGVTLDGAVACMPTDRIVSHYVRESCTVYFGWRDNCNFCADPPSKWGQQRGATCEIGAGADNACGAPFVDAQWVPQIGINTDGDVDDNDTFFMGISCDEASTMDVVAPERCPFGTLLRGIDEAGDLVCSEPASIASTVRDGCSIYLGYRDSCSGCTDPPVKWGSTRTTGCDAAVASTCGTHGLDATMVQLVGIRTDGDVDGNDKFYVGWSCQ